MEAIHVNMMLLMVLLISVLQSVKSSEQEETKDVGSLQYLSGFGFGSIGKRSEEDAKSRLFKPRFNRI